MAESYVHWPWPGLGGVVKCSRVGWMGSLTTSRWCSKCGIKASERYKIYRLDVDHYRLTYPRYDGVYCQQCAEYIVTLEKLNDVVNDE